MAPKSSREKAATSIIEDSNEYIKDLYLYDYDYQDREEEEEGGDFVGGFAGGDPGFAGETTDFDPRPGRASIS